MRNFSESRHIRLMVAGLILLLSLWIQIQVVTRTVVDTPIRADATSYVSYAWNLRQHHVFSRARSWSEPSAKARPDKMTLPGYPAFLALLMNDNGPDNEFIKRATFVQALLGAATVFLTMLSALRLLPWRWAMTATLLVAISPHLATISTYLLTESLFTLLVSTSLYCLIRTVQSDHRILGWAVAAGLMAGVASLVRPQWMLGVLGLVIVVLVSRRHRPRWRQLAAGVFALLLVLAPWHIRNANTPRAASDPDLLAITLYHGSFPLLRYHGIPETRGFPYRFDPDAQAHSKDAYAALRWIGEEFNANPGEMTAWYLAGKPAFFLSWGIIAGMGDVFIYEVESSPYINDPVFRSIRDVMYLLHWPLVILAVLFALSLFASKERWVRHAHSPSAAKLLAVVFIALIVAHMFGAPYPRYGIPFRPLIILLAMVAAHAGSELWRERVRSEQ